MPPEEVKRTTLFSLMCLLNEKEPGERRVESTGDFMAVMERAAAEEAAWATPIQPESDP